jgi:hypothetical protein
MITTIGVTRLQSGRRSFGKKELSLDRCLGLEISHGVIVSAEDLPERRKRAVPLFNYNMASALQLNTITEFLSRLPNVTLQSCKHGRRVNGNPGWLVELRSPLTKAAGDFRQSSAGTGAVVLIRPLFKSSLKFSDHAHLSGQYYWHSLQPLYSSSHSVSKTGSTSTIW